MLAALVAAFFASGLGAIQSTPHDLVASLPTFGKLPTKQYAGYANATADGHNRLFCAPRPLQRRAAAPPHVVGPSLYSTSGGISCADWFVECVDCGNRSNEEIPLVLWLNGGPGASSITGLLIEKLGPLMISKNGTLVANPDHITKKHHLLVIDNPVGSGYSTTDNGAYVHSETQVRTQFVHALHQFFNWHPEYRDSPFWVTGESYAGHYVPNIAWEIAVNATDIKLQGIVVGNGMYNMKLQYNTLGKIAFANGLIDPPILAKLEARQDSCIRGIDADPGHEGAYCENVTVRWLYSRDGPAGESPSKRRFRREPSP